MGKSGYNQFEITNMDILFILTILKWLAIVGFVGFLFVALFLLYGTLVTNDFPHRRRYCTSTVNLNGKTAVVTGILAWFRELSFLPVGGGVCL